MKVRLQILDLVYIDDDNGRLYRSKKEAEGQQNLF
jgi:hypothetical protein